MSIEKAMKEAANAGAERSREFSDQIQKFRQFSDRMEQAGVVPKKPEFTIPLMERIVTAA